MNKRSVLLLSPVLFLLSCSHLQMGMFLFHDNLTENDPKAITRGRAAYVANCAQCHGENADGRGELATTLSTPPTDFTASAYRKSPTRIGGHISYGKGSAMPPFVDKLPERTIWDIANYLHSLQGRPREHS